SQVRSAPARRRPHLHSPPSTPPLLLGFVRRRRELHSVTILGFVRRRAPGPFGARMPRRSVLALRPLPHGLNADLGRCSGSFGAGAAPSSSSLATRHPPPILGFARRRDTIRRGPRDAAQNRL